MNQTVDYLYFLMDHNQIRGLKDDSLEVAASNGDLELVKWVHDNHINKANIVRRALYFSYSRDYLDVSRWLLDQHPRATAKKYLKDLILDGVYYSELDESERRKLNS